jgi:sulfur carrier protein ThiS
MKIEIRLFGVFRIDRFEQAVRAYPTGTRVREVIADLALPPHLLGIVVINGRHATTEQRLQDGDALTLLPLLDGG